MDNFTRFHNDISRAYERMDIGEELIMIGQRIHCGRLDAIGNEMLDSRDDDYVDFDSLVGAFQLALWTIEDDLDDETSEELDELLTRAELAKGEA